MSSPDQDAQRRLEQQALKNVRSLLDKAEAESQRETHAAHFLVVLFLVISAGIVLYVRVATKPASTEVFVSAPPAMLPESRAVDSVRGFPPPPDVARPHPEPAPRTPRVAVPVAPMPSLPRAAAASCDGSFLTRPKVDYPWAARYIDQEGWVILDFDVDEQGTPIPSTFRVAAASPKGVFEASVFTAMRKAQATAGPARSGCRAQFVFKLTD